MYRFVACCLSLVVANSGFAPAAEPIVFHDATEEAGLRKPLAGLMGHGAAVGDFDGDGRTDIFVGGFGDRSADQYPSPDELPRNQLLKNRTDGTFQVVDQPIVQELARTSGAVFADLDNNGTLELVVANNTRDRVRGSDERIERAKLQRSHLFRNDGGTLVDITAESGAIPESLLSLRNIGILDFNQDGLLDLFLVEDQFRRGGGNCRLMRNVGNLSFEDATEDAGLPEGVNGLGLAIADLNSDGRPDLFVPHSNRMFLSLGNGRYEEPESLRNVFSWDPLHSEDWPCGAAFGDLNGDGRLDLVLSIHSVVARNRVYLNESSGGEVSFREVTSEVGLGESVPVRCPHVEIQDFNNDSLPDIYVSAAWKEETGAIVPLIYVNQGLRDGLPRFEPPKAFDDSMVYFPAGPSGDFDNDGRLDLFLVNWFDDNHSRLLLNRSQDNNWLRVKVHGTLANRMGIGARIEVYHSGRLGEEDALIGVQEIATGYGYASGQAAHCHFGLGQIDEVDVRVTLPGGKQVMRQSVPANRSITIRETEEENR